jgi:imidazolonepropionase-like amidohydrolase
MTAAGAAAGPGSIEAGKLAGIIFVDGDPLAGNSTEWTFC